MTESVQNVDPYLCGHVLVVDDEPANSGLLSDLLLTLGNRK